MKPGAGRGAKARDIPGIGRDFRLEQRDVEGGSHWANRATAIQSGAAFQDEAERTIQKMAPPSARRKIGRNERARPVARPLEIWTIW